MQMVPQAAQSIPLYLDIVPEDIYAKVADKLSRILAQNNNTLDFGMLGSKPYYVCLLNMVMQIRLYELAINEDMPSWGYWMKQGLTTLSEKWKIFNSSKDQSLNHIFMGDISAGCIIYWQVLIMMNSILIQHTFLSNRTLSTVWIGWMLNIIQ